MMINLGRRLLRPAALILPVLFLTACAAGSPVADPAAGVDPNPAAAAPPPSAAGAMAAAVDPDLLADFAAAQQAINADWDAFHTDFDAWRAGLTACDRSAVTAALREFAGDFDGIAASARNLPSGGITRGLAYPVFDAAAIEGSLLRRYRDNWQPGNTDLAEALQSQRTQAAWVLRDTADQLDELGERDDPEQRAAAQALAEALEPINTAWDAAHQDYADLSRRQAEIAPVAEVSARVSALIKLWNLDLIEPLQKLESEDAAVADLADELLAAAQYERDTLTELRDSIDFRAEEISAAAAAGPSAEDLALIRELEQSAGIDGLPPDAAQERDGMAEPTPEPPSDPEPVDNSDLFYGMTAEVAATNQIRKENRRALDSLIEGFKESDRQALADFTAALARLQGEWDDFHSDYDEWVSAAGGCDRAAAAQALAEFQQRFQQLGARVRGLSQASYLRPTSDLLTAAVDGEAAALRGLVTSWRPYAADVYRPLDRERSQAATLRRQADRRTQETLARFGSG